MIIGGFAKNSLIDFPGNIACVVFTKGCNFKCPYCHNPELVAGPENGSGHFFDEDKILEFLKKRKGLLQGVAITGGEPTLQPDLIEFCREIKFMGYNIKLDTNGTRPKVLSALMNDNLVDYLAMDIKTAPDNYGSVWKGKPRIKRIIQSVELIMTTAPEYEFRTTCVRPFVTMETLPEMGRLINGAKKYILQQCSKDVDVLNPEFLKKGNPYFTQGEIEMLRRAAAPFADTVVVR